MLGLKSQLGELLRLFFNTYFPPFAIVVSVGFVCARDGFDFDF